MARLLTFVNARDGAGFIVNPAASCVVHTRYLNNRICNIANLRSIFHSFIHVQHLFKKIATSNNTCRQSISRPSIIIAWCYA